MKTCFVLLQYTFLGTRCQHSATYKNTDTLISLLRGLFNLFSLHLSLFVPMHCAWLCALKYVKDSKNNDQMGDLFHDYNELIESEVNCVKKALAFV